MRLLSRKAFFIAVAALVAWPLVTAAVLARESDVAPAGPPFSVAFLNEE